MKKFKGTPGPWFWENGVLCNKDFIVGGDGHHFHNNANRNLISAAPELLEALQFINNAINHGTQMDIVKGQEMAESAINKALGE